MPDGIATLARPAVKLTELTDLTSIAIKFPLILPGVQAINVKYAALGGGTGFLGAPTIVHAKTPNGKGWYRHYAGGSIYWSPATGAREVHGLIRGKWAALGWENGFLGFPTSDETVGGASGRFSNFQGGVVYWTPATGAHEVHGAILGRYLQLGAEKSFLGYPVSDEVAGAGQSRVSNFQHGQIAWSAAHGAATSWTSYAPPASGGGGPGTHPQGVPGGGSGQPDVRRRLVCAAHMDLTDDETWGSDEHGSADKQNEAVLTNELPQDVLTMQKGAGGEMRVELTLIGQVKLSGDVLVQGTALLYEGTSETTSDLDGDLDFTLLVPRDGVLSRTVTVWNEDEGGDKGVIAMTFTNFAA